MLGTSKSHRMGIAATSEDELRAALAAVGAAAGTGCASGRELVLFFAQLGRAGWIGVFMASAAFGAMLGAVCRFARRTGAAGLPGVYWRQLGPAAGTVAGVMHGILLAMTAAMMLSSAGQVGALTLPVRHGYLCGAALALLIALVANLRGLRALPWMGLLAAASGIAFYAALAVDPRPVRVYLRGETALALWGNLPAAAALALLYAALNASIAAGVTVRFSGGRVRPAGVGALAGAMLCALLLCGNAAIARGGEVLLGQALPTVLLAARWGSAGFWISSGFSFLCAVSTLAAVLAALPRRFRRAG